MKWKLDRSSRESVKDPGSPGPKGFVFFALTLLVVYLSVSWLRADPKFSSALQLTSALHYVLGEGVIDATPEAVFQAAANGLTASLDPFSAYMPADELSYFEEETSGEYVGIGVEVKISSGSLVIVRVLPQTSAADAMLHAGDRIEAINDIPTAGFNLLRAVELMRGPEGSSVPLRILSPTGEERTLILERRAVSVSPFPIQGISRGGTAYIRWTDFTEGSADHLAAMIESMSVESPIGLILDLRGNPGGLLDEAVSAAGIFLPPDALVCRVVDRFGKEDEEYRTGVAPATFAGPVVVIMDENSASASEIFAAALQESGRALVVGRRSFGKGWVQNVFPFSDGSALRLSTARYYTPAGHTFGDPTVRIPDEDEPDTGSVWFEPSGLEPDSALSSLPIGPWEETLAQRGLFEEFASEYVDEWPDDNLLEVLRVWCDSLAIRPVGLGATMSDSSYVKQTHLTDLSDRRAWERVRSGLKTANALDEKLLFEREGTALSLSLWEQRMFTVGRPDEDELETFIAVDPDLAVARDFLEQPDRYRDAIQRRTGAITSDDSGSR